MYDKEKHKVEVRRFKILMKLLKILRLVPKVVMKISITLILQKIDMC